MKNYCFKYPTCPVCHEPHNTGSVLKKVQYDEACESSGSSNKFYCKQNMEKYGHLNSEFVEICLYKCSNCGTYFRNHIDLSNFEKIREVTGVVEKNFPFYWNISLNPIEKAYVEWIPDIVKGQNYCIYWPWNEVNFLPIFLSEYNKYYSDEKIVILDKFNKEMDYITKPDIYTYLKNLYVYDNDELSMELQNELRPFKNKIQKHLLFKNDFIHYHVKFLSKNQVNEDFSEDYKEYPSKLTTTYIRKKFEDIYGKGTVNSINLEESKKGGKYNPKSPLLDIKATYEPQWGGRPKVNVYDYWKILANYSSLDNVAKTYDIFNKNIKLVNDNIFILNYYSKTLMEDINSINPDLLIIRDSENIFLNYQSTIRNNLLDYINLNDNLTTLSFSTDKNKRFKYGYLIKNYLNHSVIHSWDNDEILNQINFSDSSILSSDISDIEQMVDLNITYYEIPELGDIDSVSEELINKFGKYAKTFFKFLIQTPVQIMDDSNEFNFRFNGMDLGYWFEKLYYQNNNEFLDNVMKTFGNVYLDNRIAVNPLINKIKFIIDNNLNDFTKIVLIIPSDYYKKTITHIFKNEFNEDKLVICKWNQIDLSVIDNVLLISSIKPYDSFDFNKYNIQKYIFVGSPNSIKDIEDLVLKKTSCDITRPLISLVGENYAPKLLYECFENVPEVDKKITLQNTIIKTEEINVKKREEVTSEENQWTDNIETERKDRILHEKQNVILLLNEFDEGIFIPKKHSLTYKKDNTSLAVFDFNNKKLKKEDLIGKEVIIDNNGFYRSYKEFFIKFMIENYTSNLTDFPHDRLNNFKQLNDKAYSWLNVLHDILNRLHSENLNSNLLKTKKEFAQIIKSYLKTNYTLESIINSWLSEPEIINTSEGVTVIYSIEHPQNVSSLIDLYEGLSNDYNLDLTEMDAIKTYQAGIYLQKIRRSFLRNDKIPIAYIHLFNSFNRYLNQIISVSKIFTVKSIQDVKLKQDVKSYKIITDYENYI